MESEYLIACVTFPNKTSAINCARRLIQEKLAAGTNIISGLHSIYRWRDEVREHEECMLLAQVSRRCLRKFEASVLLDHPYEVPCITAVSLEFGHRPFLEWIDQECQKD